MSMSSGSPDAALGAFVAGALLITFVVLVLLAVGSLVVVVYLLIPSVQKRLDSWMSQREADIWMETLTVVDAETEKYRRQHRKDPLRRTESDSECEPAFKQGALYGQVYQEPEDVPF